MFLIDEETNNVPEEEYVDDLSFRSQHFFIKNRTRVLRAENVSLLVGH